MNQSNQSYRELLTKALLAAQDAAAMAEGSPRLRLHSAVTLLQGLVDDLPPPTIWEIWSEGFAATGEHGTATFHGRANGATFNEAVRAWMAANPKVVIQEHQGAFFMWGCKLFPTEAEARRSFG